MLDSYQHIRKEKIELHAEMSMLGSLLTTLAHLRADDYKHMRHMTIKLPRAKPTAVPAGAQECAECCLCPQHGRLAA